MKNAIPAPGVCPACGREFLVVARTGDAIGTVNASDLLEWRCSACRYREKEERRLADGVGGNWPASRFAGRDSLGHSP